MGCFSKTELDVCYTCWTRPLVRDGRGGTKLSTPGGPQTRPAEATVSSLMREALSEGEETGLLHP